MKLRKSITKGLVLGMIITNLPIYSFANEINLKENKYTKELSNIKTKEDLQKSAQKAVKAGEVDTWIEGLANMPTARDELTSAVVDGKIYCIGGENPSYTYSNIVEVYDPITDSWETKSSMPTARAYLTSAVVDGKIYCIGGHNSSSTVNNALNKVEVYDPATDSWETKTPMPTYRVWFTSAVVDNKIYCIGGNYAGYPLNEVEVYYPATDSWETKTSMPTARYGLTSAVVDGKIYCIGGAIGGSYLNTVEVYDPVTNSWETKTSMPTKRQDLTSAVVDNKIYCIGGYYRGSSLNIVEAYISKEPSLEEKVTSSVSNAESTKDPADIETARNLVNKLSDGELKNELQDRLDAIVPNISLDRKNITSNLDIYIKSENSLHMTLSTNSITFEDYNGINDLILDDAIEISINSSLPYQLNAYMLQNIQNNDGSRFIDLDNFNIKHNTDDNYKEFSSIGSKLILKDGCVSGNGIKHNIDLKLKGGNAHEADVYKTVIKFEAEQK